MNVEILNGNELIVQGGLEAGFSLYTGYPGSPLAEYFNILHNKKDELKTNGIRVAIANSEANAAAMASGAKQAGKDVMLAMKSMGLHVASDALSVGNFANPAKTHFDSRFKEDLYPGVVVVVGDDPWSMSTSTPADSRFLYKHLHIPFLEPSNPQELKDWIKHALYLSKKSSVYCGVLLTTLLAEGGGRVEVFEQEVFDPALVDIDTENFDLSQNVMVPPNSLKADNRMINQRFPMVEVILESMKLDKIYGNNDAKVGVISSGVIFETLKQYLEESKTLNDICLYKIATPYPLVKKQLLPFLEKLTDLIVVEEKRGFLETEIKEFLQANSLNLNVWGKNFKDEEGFPAYGGLDYEIIQKKFQDLSSINVLSKSGETCSHQNIDISELPKRLPTFCPGCPHRETLSLLKEIRGILKKDSIDLVTHGDVGCYSLSFLPPFKEMHNLSAMGQGGALGAGLDIFSKNPSVVLMGDSTFFHSGLTDVSNSLQLGHDITYILLDNDNTAMTGHQMTPASGISVEGLARPRQDMLNVVKSLGVNESIKVNPSDRYFYKNLLLDYVKKPGVKVIVSDKECSLTFQSRKRSQERKILKDRDTLALKTFYQINTDACEDCRECVELTGCPGLTQVFDAYGTKVQIDPQICVNDSYCTQIKACPSFEMVNVKNYHVTKYKDKSFKSVLETPVAELKEEEKCFSFENISKGQDLRIIVTGVGGSGITTISKILSHACVNMSGRDDIDFKFVDQKGLAQRNGNVTAHLSLFAKGKSSGAQIPQKTADILISTDLLDATSKANFLKEEGSLIADESFQYPLNILLDRNVTTKPFTVDSTKEILKKFPSIQKNIYPFKELSSKIFGRPVYATSMSLGVFYQKGFLPFSLKDLKDSIKKSIREDEAQSNLEAFHLGRMLVSKPEIAQDLLKDKSKLSLTKEYEESLLDSILPWRPRAFYLDAYKRNLTKLCEFYPDIRPSFLAKYLHDIFIFDRGSHLEDFMREAGMIKVLYHNIYQQKIALRALAKTYFVKDEVMVSHLMISKKRSRLDQERFMQVGSSFTKKFINRPAFDFLGRKVEFDISPKLWMLKTMRHLRFLRLLMPLWHRKDRLIAKQIRIKILDTIPKKMDKKSVDWVSGELKKLDNIKGYRDVKYKYAKLNGIEV